MRVRLFDMNINPPQPWQAGNEEPLSLGRRTNFFWHPFCRINAAFRRPVIGVGTRD